MKKIILAIMIASSLYGRSDDIVFENDRFITMVSEKYSTTISVNSILSVTSYEDGIKSFEYKLNNRMKHMRVCYVSDEDFIKIKKLFIK
jgi:hypothetical protein